MRPKQDLDVAAILTAVYRRPVQPTDQVASRVRARLALLETLGEGMRLLFEAPAFAVLATLNPALPPPAEGTDASRRKG